MAALLAGRSLTLALNSVKPAWPELALPGVHSDIGGGYNPDEHEIHFLTHPQFETVPLAKPDSNTRIYQQAGGKSIRMVSGRSVLVNRSAR